MIFDIVNTININNISSGNISYLSLIDGQWSIRNIKKLDEWSIRNIKNLDELSIRKIKKLDEW